VNNPGRIVAVQRGLSAPLLAGGRSVASAIRKTRVIGRVDVRALGLDGDEQADPSVHGGLAKAVYAYPHEHYPFWRTVRAQARVATWDAELPTGAMGENLTTLGVLEGDCWVGDRWVFESGLELAVSEPRLPCFKFSAAMGFAQASSLMLQSAYCGCYLAVVCPGAVAEGDVFRVEPGLRELSLRELFHARRARAAD
jgi:MOSC domain-containing protein YiiM